MNCPRCGAPSNVLETRQSKRDMTTTRGRMCFNNHRFKTVEIHEPVYCSAEQRNVKFVQATAKRIRLWKRDIQIAKQLSAQGWQSFADMFGLTKSAVYLAARRGEQWYERQQKSGR
jgi:hypothetical protein